jgi:hypothetical protein
MWEVEKCREAKGFVIVGIELDLILATMKECVFQQLSLPYAKMLQWNGIQLLVSQQ